MKRVQLLKEGDDVRRDYGTGKVVIDKITVPTQKVELTTCNILECEVGTTGYKGGDSGHGCRTYLKLKDHASTDMRLRVNGEEIDVMDGQIELIFGGDTELDTLRAALRFALAVLDDEA